MLAFNFNLRHYNKDHENRGALCKHILRVLLDMADLSPPAPPSPAMMSATS
jgi:hypothetical protein